jgi:hypothetical protein
MKKAKAILILLLICLSKIGFTQSNGRNLQQAYKDQSLTELNQFLDNWNKKIPAISDAEYAKLNDTVKQAYNVFSTFYRPLNIEALGGSEWGNQIYDKAHYLIVQNTASVYLRTKIYTNTEIDSIVVSETNKSNLSDSVKNNLLRRRNNRLSRDAIERFTPYDLYDDDKDRLILKVKGFCPTINCGDKKALYLTPKYDTLLNAFLGNTQLPLGAGGIMNPARSSGESGKRQKFLENFIKIWYGHWGGYWQLYSYPTADAIIFDKSMKYAIVKFRMVYEGGEAILKNNNGKWELLSSKRTWIE